ncbi:replication-associated protein [Sewage-associated circular DNA virus-2]|uniref:replication-associated protein n=1 Tax=Sewage-associated circular DNA virus-2 TaxID=1519391 RepID=UPI00050D388B|nr:replication-associated protein [Sewage-associated circular DNA virus-2]AIF34808.2 replication-associated protein [Sewage-associated circular DNA virus-2]
MTRFAAKQFFLTYPRCDLDLQLLLDGLTTALAPRLFRHKIVQERHGDEGLHVHAIIVCAERIDTSNPRFFDVAGFHPNIQTVRNLRQAYTYLDKEPVQALCNLDEPIPKMSWGELLEKATDAVEFMNLMKKYHPRDYILSFTRLLDFAEVHFTEPPPLYETPEGYSFLTYRPKSLVLIGPSRTGKTTWARSLGRHVYWNSLVNLDVWSPLADYIIFDDVDIDFLPGYKCWLGAQKEFTVTDKYKKKRKIMWGKPCIWLCIDDKDPLLSSKVYRDWISMNCVFVTVINKMY